MKVNLECWHASALLTRGCLNKWQDERGSSAHTFNLILLSTNSYSPQHSLLSPPLQAQLPSSIAFFTLFRSFSPPAVDCRYVAAGPVDPLRRSPWAFAYCSGEALQATRRSPTYTCCLLTVRTVPYRMREDCWWFVVRGGCANSQLQISQPTRDPGI